MANEWEYWGRTRPGVRWVEPGWYGKMRTHPRRSSFTKEAQSREPENMSVIWRQCKIIESKHWAYLIVLVVFLHCIPSSDNPQYGELVLGIYSARRQSSHAAKKAWRRTDSASDWRIRLVLRYQTQYLVNSSWLERERKKEKVKMVVHG